MYKYLKIDKNQCVVIKTCFDHVNFCIELNIFNFKQILGSLYFINEPILRKTLYCKILDDAKQLTHPLYIHYP